MNSQPSNKQSQQHQQFDQWRFSTTPSHPSSSAIPLPQGSLLSMPERLGNRQAASHAFSPFNGPSNPTKRKASPAKPDSYVYSRDGAALKYDSPFSFVDREVRQKRRHDEMMSALARMEGLLTGLKKPRLGESVTTDLVSFLNSLKDETMHLRRQFEQLDNQCNINTQQPSLPTHNMETALADLQYGQNRLDLITKRNYEPIMLRLRVRL